MIGSLSLMIFKKTETELVFAFFCHLIYLLSPFIFNFLIKEKNKQTYIQFDPLPIYKFGFKTSTRQVFCTFIQVI